MNNPLLRTHRPGERLLRSLALFGLTLDDVEQGRAEHTRRRRGAHAAADRLVPALRPGVLVMITGPSGSGKSTLARILAARARRGQWRVRCAHERDAHAAASVAESLHGPLVGEHGALRALASAGLADATLLGRPPSRLSGGQRFRLSLARALLRCAPSDDRRPTLLVADEFAVALDRPSAKCLSAAVRRWVDRSMTPEPEHVGHAAVIATPHDDLLEFLRPDVLVTVSEEGTFEMNGVV